MSKSDEFWTWGEQELRKRDLSWHRVEMEAGLSNAAISRRARENKPPTFDTCVAISAVFRLPLEHVLQEAGMLKGNPNVGPSVNELLYLATRLSRDDLDRLLAIARTFSEGLRYTIRRDKALSVAENSGADPSLDDSD